MASAFVGYICFVDWIRSRRLIHRRIPSGLASSVRAGGGLTAPRTVTLSRFGPLSALDSAAVVDVFMTQPAYPSAMVQITETFRTDIGPMEPCRAPRSTPGYAREARSVRAVTRWESNLTAGLEFFPPR
jgi:hypothetical protein